MFNLSNDEIEVPPMMTDEEEFYAGIDQYYGNGNMITDKKDSDPEYFVTPWAQFYV